ncbi:UNVERIFIED_ORG: hypothetical protein DFS12_1043 [Chitinophaga ginsengisegetis]|nr:hypothetical protein [Chitinophaga ginsengisegetis]MDR6647942.1 hypothetical protein [Chitinophaga ginsengisegetis]MDR6654907.1 hypothetical protein [Chitinophaga ginsengisegetis]
MNKARLIRKELYNLDVGLRRMCLGMDIPLLEAGR